MFHIMCALRFGTAPAEWRWMSNDGQRWTPKDMETRHLWMTVRMIWNNAIAPELPVDPGVTYAKLGRPSRRPYMLEALRYCAAELAGREDLEPHWEAGLNLMAKHVRERRFNIVEGCDAGG